jgi:hypothetical protein
MCGRALGSFPLEKLSPPVGAQPGGAVSAAQRSPFVDPGLDGSNRHLILLFGSEGAAGLESSRVLWTIQTWSTTFWCDHKYAQEGYVSKNRGRLSVLSQPQVHPKNNFPKKQGPPSFHSTPLLKFQLRCVCRRNFVFNLQYKTHYVLLSVYNFNTRVIGSKWS